MKKPKIGDIVIFTSYSSKKFPAIVMEVGKETCRLQIFDCHNSGNIPYSENSGNIPYSESSVQECWSWPEEEKQECDRKHCYDYNKCAYCKQVKTSKEEKQQCDFHEYKNSEENSAEWICKNCDRTRTEIEKSFIEKFRAQCEHEYETVYKRYSADEALRCKKCMVIKEEKPKECEHIYGTVIQSTCNICSKLKPTKAEELIEELLSKIVYSIYKSEKVGISFCAVEMCREIESLIKEYKGIK